MLDARRGMLGDLTAALERTSPKEWWRAKLVAAYAMAAQGDLDGATRTLRDAERELGVARVRRLRVARRGAHPPGPARAAARRRPGRRVGRGAGRDRSGDSGARRLRVVVMGGPIVVMDGTDRAADPGRQPAAARRRDRGAAAAR